MIDFFSRGQFVAKIILVAQGLELILVNMMLNPNGAARRLMPQQKLNKNMIEIASYHKREKHSPFLWFLWAAPLLALFWPFLLSSL